MDLQELKFKVETAELDAAITKIDKLGTAVKGLAKPMDEAAKTAEKTSKATKKIADSSAEAEAGIQKISKGAAKGVRDAEALIAKQENMIRDMINGFSRGEAGVLAIARGLKSTPEQMQRIIANIQEMAKYFGDPFDSSIGAVRAITKQFELLEQRAHLAKEGISLTNAQLKLYSRLGIEAAGQVKLMGFDPTAGEGLARYNQLLSEETAKFKDKVRGINDITAAEKAHQKSLKDTETAMRAGIGVGDTMVVQYRKRQAAIQKEIDKLKEQRDALLANSSVTTGNVNFRLMSHGASPAQLKEANAYRKEIEEVGKAARRAESPLKGLASIVRQLIPAIGALSVGAVIAQIGVSFSQTADFLTLFESRLNYLSKGTIDFNKTFSELVTISNDARVSVQDTSTFFSRLVPIMKSVGRSTEDALTVTSSFSKLLLVSGVSSREASSSMYQLSQALGKGKLDGDEFRTMAEAVPEILRMFEKELGVTRAELYKMSEQGRLTTDVINSTLMKALPELTKVAANMPKTVEGEFTKLRNTMTEIVLEVEKSIGLNKGMADSVSAVNDAFKKLGENADEALIVLGAVTGAVVLAGLAKLTVAVGLVGIAFLSWPFVAIAAAVGAAVAASEIMDRRTKQSADLTKARIAEIQNELKKLDYDPKSSMLSDVRGKRYAALTAELKEARGQLALFNTASYSLEEAKEERRQNSIKWAAEEEAAIDRWQMKAIGVTKNLTEFYKKIGELKELGERGKLSPELVAAEASKLYQEFGFEAKPGTAKAGGSRGTEAAVKSPQQLSEEMRAEGIRAITNSEIEAIFAANERNRVTAEGNTALRDQIDMLGLTEEQIYAKSRADELAIINEKERNLLFSANIPQAEQELKLLRDKYNLTGELKQRTAALGNEAVILADIAKLTKDTADLEARKATMGMSPDDAALYNRQREIQLDLEAKIADVRARGAATEVQQADIARLTLLADQNILLAQQAKLIDSIDKVSSDMADAFTNAFGSVIDGSKNSEDALKDLEDQIKKIIIDILILQPLKASLTGFLGSVGGMVASAISGTPAAAPVGNYSLSSGGSGLGLKPPGLADGGAFMSGVQKFANGGSFTNKIVNKPTNFNIGQMGEAGPEAIMPLMRTSSGALGVQSSGGSGSNVSVVVVNNTSEKAETKETVDSKGNRRVEVMIGDMVAGEMGRSSSGIQRSMKSTFGLQPSLVRR